MRIAIRSTVLLTVIFILLAVAGCDSRSGRDANEVVLYSVLPTKIRGLDPGDIGDVYSSLIAAQSFECLYQYHYLKRPYELIPQLAEGMPDVSDDGLVYTIKLKKGVYFSNDVCFENGKTRELTAEDFVFAWKRIADIKYLSKNWWIFDNKIVGLDEFREYTKTCKKAEDVDYSRYVEGLQTPDDYTLIIKLKKTWPQITYLLAHLPTAPIAKEAVDYYGEDIVSHPVGTGPYILKKWHRGSCIELVRNPNFRGELYPSEGEPDDLEQGFLADAAVQLPMVGRISFMLIEEDQPRWLQFLRGKLDASGIPKDNFNQAIDASKSLTPEMKQHNIHLKTFRDPSTFWLGFNMEDPILGKNKPLREAISYALDRQKYIELFWNGRDEAAYGFIPPLMKAYNPQISKIGKSYNPSKAVQLISEAEKIYGGKLPTLILSTGGTDTLSRQMGQFWQRCFKDVGLDVEIRYMDWPTFQDKVKTKSTQMFGLGWIADYPDAENFLQLFYSKNVSPGTNNFNYSNPDFDRIYEQVAVMPDCPQRTEFYRKAEQIVIEDCPAAFINHRVAYVLHHDWVANYKPHVFQYGLSKYRRIDTAKRAAYKGR
ncbi:MAG: ABC transporter substrate-binding protein [Planctomycetes bacterium]|nr:ABC transporter substrate-binding protein [Planctomycetota bacterium]